ncbi:MAG TPA: septal ring lytic transglycosylase RlpA family protein [Hyphomicrobiaceae bacterium]|jgi:rare lipoprotein A
MFRMLTLIWAMGIVLYAPQAQAVAPMGEYGPSRTAMVSEVQTSKTAPLANQVKKSAKRTTRARRKTAQRHRVAHARKYTRHHAARSTQATSRRASRTRRSKAVYAYRSRRITEVGSQASVKQQAKRSPRVASSKTRRKHRSVPVGTTMSGLASYYWQPQRVASGGWFNPKAMTAAHKTLPFGTRVRVTNKRNGRSVEVTINDRGPYVGGRIIDLSDAAAGAIGMKSAGVVPVNVEVVGR